MTRVRVHVEGSEGTDEDLGECTLRLLVARGQPPRLLVVVPSESEARCYRIHPDDAAEPLPARLRVWRADEGHGALRLVRRVERRAGSGYARGL